MKKIISFFRSKNYIIFLIPLAVVVGVYFLFFRSPKMEKETTVVHPGDFLQQVSVSGKVVAAQNVDIAASDGGLVSLVYVKVGQSVAQGEKLLAIDTSSLQASLNSAKSAVNLKRAEIKNKETNIEQITKEQNTLVENARRTMLSNGLVAVADTGASTATPPTISGAYTGEEGVYKIIVDRKNATGDDFEVRTFELEKTPNVVIKDNEPTALGTRGLFISFPETLSRYVNIQWYVTIPNKKSNLYTQNFNAYSNALDTRTRVIADAEADLAQSNGTSILYAELAQAEAEVQSIEADIADRIPRAPFAGLITRVDAKVGETISSGEAVVEMISSGVFQVESFVPEINISLLAVGNPASVTLDAYGTETFFDAKVISIDPAETLQDGVSTYRTLLQFDTEDERIKSGMTANVVITTDQKSGVITVPQGIVVDKNGKKFVTILNGTKEVEQEVTTGGVSSLGQIEITSGLNDGDVVVLPPATP